MALLIDAITLQQFQQSQQHLALLSLCIRIILDVARRTRIQHCTKHSLSSLAQTEPPQLVKGAETVVWTGLILLLAVVVPFTTSSHLHVIIFFACQLSQVHLSNSECLRTPFDLTYAGAPSGV